MRLSSQFLIKCDSVLQNLRQSKFVLSFSDSALLLPCSRGVKTILLFRMLFNLECRVLHAFWLKGGGGGGGGILIFDCGVIAVLLLYLKLFTCLEIICFTCFTCFTCLEIMLK